jgi:exopolyphosphatase/guanosine-5'-triphosphate,3'-diphosphate pyrophosphatase
MTKIAIIDMGTNTFHLLMAELGPAGYKVFLREFEPVKIGLAGINEGYITAGGCERAIHAMKKFRKTIDQHNISTIHAFGTSALRNASNGPALAGEITSLTGINIRIISGDEEAELIFAGVRAAMDLGNEPGLVMDIGAGSVEFIVGNRREILWKQSFEIGGQRLLEKFHRKDPITREEIVALDLFFEKTLSPLLRALEDFQPRTLIGSAGTFDTLSDIYCIRQQIPRTMEESETPLSVGGFYEIYQELIQKDRNQRMQIDGMVSLRVDMIVVASCLIRFVLEKHKFDNIRVSAYSLKEGVLANLSQPPRTS